MLFGELLMKRRRELNMTQDELAEKLSVSRQSVSRWENGECMPDSEKLIRLSDVLGVSLDELAGHEVKTEPAVSGAPSIPKKKRGAAAAIAAAVIAAAFAAAGFFAGRLLFPREASERVCELPEALSLSGFAVDDMTDEGVIDCSFVCNAEAEGTVCFYPADRARAPVSAGTVRTGNVHTVRVRLAPGVRYEKAVFSVWTETEKLSAVLVTDLIYYAEGGVSYNDMTYGNGLCSADGGYPYNEPADNGAAGGAAEDGEGCAAQLLSSESFPEDDFIVPFDRETTFFELYSYVLGTYPQLDEAAARSLAQELTDRIERIRNAIDANDIEGLEHSYTEDGALIVSIGKMVGDALEPEG